MQYAERLPSVPSPKSVAAPIVALVLGAAAATGAYALIDNNSDQIAQVPSKVIVLDTPSPVSEGVNAKNEAGTAAAIGSIPAPGEGVNAKDEAGTAVAISPLSGRLSRPGEGVNAKDEAGAAAAISGTQLRGSKASDTGRTVPPTTQEPTDPHDTAVQLHRLSGN